MIRDVFGGILPPQSRRGGVLEQLILYKYGFNHASVSHTITVLSNVMFSSLSGISFQAISFPTGSLTSAAQEILTKPQVGGSAPISNPSTSHRDPSSLPSSQGEGFAEP